MSHPYSRRATVSLRRADFLALGHAVLGVGFLLLGVWYALDSGVGLGSAGYDVSGLVLLVVAGYYNRNPGLIDRGTQPTPQRWIALAGVALAAVVVLAVAAYALDSLL